MDPQLLMAARAGNLKVIRAIADIKGNIILDQTTHHGNTALHMAARLGHVEVVREIIDHYPSLVLKSNLKGETPLHVAARAGQVDIVAALMQFLQGFGNVFAARIRDRSGETPLHAGVRNNHVRVVKTLAVHDRDSLILVNDAGESPLSIAIDLRFFDISRYVLGHNPATIEYRGPDGQTPLHYAVSGRDLRAMVEILEAKRELVRAEDGNKQTPLHYAAALGRQKMVEELLKQYPSVAYQVDQDGRAPIHLAAEEGQLSVFKALLEPCPDSVELSDNKQQNILHIAARNGNLDIVKHILGLPEMEDLVNSPDLDGNTPLHLAAMNFHSTVVYVLSRNPKAEIRALNKSKRTALSIIQSSDDRGLELQQHLTLKALKRSYAKRGVKSEDRLEHASVDNKNPERGSKSKEMAQTLSVMATLIATFTFTAAFTLPGGLKSDGSRAGTPLLIGRTAFQAFVVTDTIAMTSSITAAVIVFWSSANRDHESFMDALPFAICLTWISLVAMGLAFVTGLFVVLSDCLWLAILVSVIGCASPVFLYILAPLMILAFDRRSSDQSATSRRYHIVENNPFVFIGRFIKMKYW